LNPVPVLITKALIEIPPKFAGQPPVNPDGRRLLRTWQGAEGLANELLDALKDVMAQLEHPFYSLSKKPETSIRKYEHNGNWIQITPSVKGQATIYDKDILIYCISQIMAKLKRSEPVEPPFG
jgi:adenine-specific DNA methylase